MDDSQNLSTASDPNNGTKIATDDSKGKSTLVIVIVVVLVLVALLGVGVFLLVKASPETTSRWRDIFIIFMALEFLIIGLALIILMVQLATLINLLQNEIKPILNSTNETVSTLRGTATFLSDNLVEPVIKLNEYLAGLKRAMDLMHINRH
jgi:hypothetical protein